MGNIKLDKNRALDKLGKSSKSISLGEFKAIATYETDELFKKNGFARLEQRG